MIFMDLSMPVMDGIEATEEIKSLVGNLIPIIIISAYSDPETIENCISVGADGYITKPGSITAIEEILI